MYEDVLPVPRMARLHIWEISKNWHCSIIGTCLTFGDAVKIGRKFGAKCDDPTQLNAVIHAMLVRDCRTKNPISVYVEKTLNKKHAAAIKKFHSLTTDEEILQKWKLSFQNGLIPGAYWAVATSPVVGKKTSTRVFSDVHMLSHMLGNSNQQVISRVAELEEKIAVNENKLTRLRETGRQREETLRQQKIAQDAEISTLKVKLLRLKDVDISANERSAVWKEKCAVAEAKIKTLEDRNQRALSALNLQHGLSKNYCDEIQRLTLANNELETLISRLAGDSPSKNLLNLGNRHILYVGGLARSFENFEKAIHALDGRISFYSGDEGNRSGDHLSGLVSQSDLVVISIGNVSHRTALTAKKTSKHFSVDFCVVKSPGLGSLILALREYLEKMAPSGPKGKA